MRKIIEQAIIDLGSAPDVPWHNNKAIDGKRGRPNGSNGASDTQRRASARATTYSFQEVDGMNIDQLQPSRSKQRELLNQTILNMTKEEFDARNLDTNSSITATIRDNIDTEQGINRGARIQADESQCVFRF